MRDSQRSKVYKAEREVWDIAQKFDNMDQTKRYVQVVLDILDLPELKRYKVYVGDGRARRSAGGNARGIYLPKWARTPWVILHELAHTLTARQHVFKGIQHHWPWASNYLMLVTKILGEGAGKRLKEAFKKHRVRFKAPQTRMLTPEARERLRQRGLALASKRWERKNVEEKRT